MQLWHFGQQVVLLNAANCCSLFFLESMKVLTVHAYRVIGWTFSESVGSQLDLIKPNSRGNIQIYGNIERISSQLVL